jgi:hypothetical protein
LTGFRFGFGFSPILKDGFRAGNGDIDIHHESVPEPTPLISNYILSFLNYKTLNKL